MPHTPKNTSFTKFCDLKGADLRANFGEAKRIRLAPMRDNEPKGALKQPFKAGSSLIALAINFGFQNAHVWQIAVFFSVIKTVANNKLIGNFSSYIVGLDIGSSVNGLI